MPVNSNVGVSPEVRPDPLLFWKAQHCSFPTQEQNGVSGNEDLVLLGLLLLLGGLCSFGGKTPTIRQELLDN